jgi:hypothetical protein
MILKSKSSLEAKIKDIVAEAIDFALGANQVSHFSRVSTRIYQDHAVERIIGEVFLEEGIPVTKENVSRDMNWKRLSAGVYFCNYLHIVFGDGGVVDEAYFQDSEGNYFPIHYPATTMAQLNRDAQLS